MPDHETHTAPVRSFWSGTISFGLVSIPVDFYSAARPRNKAMKLVDAEGHALGRRYYCSKEGKPLDKDDIVRGYETESGEMVVVTEEELARAAPEESRDIELSRFVPFTQISPMFFERPYFLAPSGRSGKAYALLAQTMEGSGKVGIGRLVMRGREYLVAILADGGLLRAETLRYADELRPPEQIGLPEQGKPSQKLATALGKEIDRLAQPSLDMDELEDREAERLHELAERKRAAHEDVIELAGLEDVESEPGGAQVYDLMELLRGSLGGRREPARVRAGGKTSGRGSGRTSRGERGPPRRAAKAKRPTEHERADAPREGLDEASKSTLYELAGELHVAGRSRMSKAQLADAIKQVKSGS